MGYHFKFHVDANGEKLNFELCKVLEGIVVEDNVTNAFSAIIQRIPLRFRISPCRLTKRYSEKPHIMLSEELEV